MKNNLKRIVGAFFLLSTISIFMTGCIEHRYYRENHHHSPDYEHRHHRTTGAGVDVEIHN